MKTYRYLTIVLLCTLLSGLVRAENEPVILEVEDGTLGADFNILTDGDVTYAGIQTNATGVAPESEARMITMDVTFPAAGQYDLYARVRVGPNGADDDSFFYGNGFGQKSPNDADDWVRVNNVNASGFVFPEEIVTGGGSATSGVWKWINLSEFMLDEAPLVFTVEEGMLSLVFQIGAREDGLDIDKLAFGTADLLYTVDNLNKGEAPGDAEPLKPIADGHPKYLGNVYSNAQLPGFTSHWNQVTPENAGKWGSVESARDNMNWNALDAAYDLAKDNGFIFRLHVLVWGNQQPSWMESLSPAEQLMEIKEWFAALASRYDDIDIIEVVNEPLHDPPDGPGDGNYIEALGGTGSTGWDWVITAFELARAHFPDTRLMVNDYNIVNSGTNTDNYIELIELLQGEDLIDAIGVQAHAFSLGASSATIQNNLDDLAATGLPIVVTEMDVDGPTDLQQLTHYQRVFPIFWEHPAVEGVTLWGYRPGMWRTDQMAYLVDLDGATYRPAFIWLREYVNGTYAPVESIDVVTASGALEIDTDDGTLQMLVNFMPEEPTFDEVTWSVNNPDLASIRPDGVLKAIDNGIVRITARAVDETGVTGSLDITISNQDGLSATRYLDPDLDAHLHPNPVVDGTLYLTGSARVVQVRITDARGRLIREVCFDGHAPAMVHLDVAPGMYFCQLIQGGRYNVQKILITH